MKDMSYSVLLVEDNQDDADIVQESLSIEDDSTFDVTHVVRVSNAVKASQSLSFDIVLLDLSLPDGTGIETFNQVSTVFPETPIIILTGLKDESVAIQSVQSGAQDFIVKDLLDPEMLARAIRFGIERHKHWAALQNLVLVDELTGLQNRRGFWTYAEQLFKMIARSDSNGYVLYFDLDNMKYINDTYGHQAGDQALIETASILKNTFRESDVIARLGGDEFAVAASVLKQHNEITILERFQRNVEIVNQSNTLDFEISISTGIVQVDSELSHPPIEKILAKADQRMYENKQEKKANVKS